MTLKVKPLCYFDFLLIFCRWPRSILFDQMRRWSRENANPESFSKPKMGYYSHILQSKTRRPYCSWGKEIFGFDPNMTFNILIWIFYLLLCSIQLSWFIYSINYKNLFTLTDMESKHDSGCVSRPNWSFSADNVEFNAMWTQFERKKKRKRYRENRRAFGTSLYRWWFNECLKCIFMSSVRF